MRARLSNNFKIWNAGVAHSFRIKILTSLVDINKSFEWYYRHQLLNILLPWSVSDKGHEGNAIPCESSQCSGDN